MRWSRIVLVMLVLASMVATALQVWAAPKVALLEVKGMVCRA